MLPTDNLPFFITSALVILVVPGPAIFYIVSRSLEQGVVAGLVAQLGITLGALVYAGVVAAGLGALLLKQPGWLAAIQIAGALYLMWMGVRGFMSARDASADMTGHGARRLSRLFLEGVWVNLTNPKTVVFFLAFLPQFVVPEAGNPALQVFLLGALFCGMGFLSDGAYAVAAGGVRRWFGRHPGGGRTAGRLSGAILFLLGLAALANAVPRVG